MIDHKPQVKKKIDEATAIAAIKKTPKITINPFDARTIRQNDAPPNPAQAAEQDYQSYLQQIS